MAREIKFRAWDNLNHRMQFDFFIDSDGAAWMNQDPHGVDMSGKKRVARTDRLEVMQFTGLKDKNGKEIYESDIIELIDDAGNTIRTQVKWGNHRRQMSNGLIVDIPGFAFIKADGAASFPIVQNYKGVHDLEIFEVIGNIYQNPELIQQPL